VPIGRYELQKINCYYTNNTSCIHWLNGASQEHMMTSLLLWRKRNLYSTSGEAESFMCTVNSTSDHVPAKFSTEPWKKTLVITKYHVCWLNWTNLTPFRLLEPSNNTPFLPVFVFSADLDLLDCQAWVMT